MGVRSVVERPIFLLGFMAAGKSTIGRGLSRRTGRPFVDLDREIERATGATIPDIFAAEGEEGFRDRETEALRRLELEELPIVATGGGVVSREENLELLRRLGVTLFLRVPFDVVARRAAASRTVRPLFRDVDEARALWFERLPSYETADFECRVDEGDAPAQVVERALALLAEGAPCGS